MGVELCKGLGGAILPTLNKLRIPLMVNWQLERRG
jgi:hypothetical protein